MVSNVYSNNVVVCLAHKVSAELTKKNVFLLISCVFGSSLGYELSPSAAANFTRKNLAEYLRSRVITIMHKKY